MSVAASSVAAISPASRARSVSPIAASISLLSSLRPPGARGGRRPAGSTAMEPTWAAARQLRTASGVIVRRRTRSSSLLGKLSAPTWVSRVNGSSGLPSLSRLAACTAASNLS